MPRQKGVPHRDDTVELSLPREPVVELLDRSEIVGSTLHFFIHSGVRRLSTGDKLSPAPLHVAIVRGELSRQVEDAQGASPIATLVALPSVVDQALHDAFEDAARQPMCRGRLDPSAKVQSGLFPTPCVCRSQLTVVDPRWLGPVL